MLLEHIGFTELSEKLNKAIDICGQYERKLVMTGRDNGATALEFGDYVMAKVKDPDLNSRWESYVQAQ